MTETRLGTTPLPDTLSTPPDSAHASTSRAGVPGDVVLYGADYNPEQWDPQVWREDVALMRQAGVNTVSLGIWSWAMLEPEEGRFDFSWFDEVVGLLTDAGISIDLATPTAAPPAWFYRAHPEAKLVEKDGTVRHGGSRGICCPHSPAYAEACERVTEAVAAHVEGNPAVTMWHVHNEYGAPGGDCHCEISQKAFRAWLRERYTDLDGINRAWGTAFWGQVYRDWAEVSTPRHSGAALNPACELDYARFTSDSLLERFKAERDVIRRHFPTTPVTTNYMATNCPANDYWQWSKEVDVVSTDYYLEAADPDACIWLSLESDLTRSLAQGRPWVLMEHSVSAVSWQPHNWAKAPGEERRNALVHAGRGADGILAFQWRQSRRGAEKFHSAMVPHAGTGTRVFREVCELGAELGALAELRGSVVRPHVALLWDWESFWAQDLTWRPSVLMRHREQVRRVYRWLWERGTTVDLIHPEADLTPYKTVIAPASYLLSDEAGANLDRFVAAGGRLACLPFCGVVDGEECVHDGGAPGPLRGVLGLTVDEIRPVREGESVRLVPADGCTRAVAGSVWSEDLRLEGAEPLWVAEDGPTPGPAVTVNHHGEGLAVYVSTILSPSDLGTVLEPLLELPTVLPELPEGRRPRLEAVTRTALDGATSWTVVANHTPSPQEAILSGTDLLTGAEFSGDRLTTVAAGDVLVLRRRLG